MLFMRILGKLLASIWAMILAQSDKRRHTWDRPATYRQRELIEAYGWKVPPRASMRQASAMIFAAQRRNLKVSPAYKRKYNALEKKKTAAAAREAANWKRQYDRDSARDNAALERATRPRKSRLVTIARFR